MAQVSIAGRIVLNLWRILRHEASLRSYALENVAYHMLHRRIPRFSPSHLHQLLTDRPRLAVQHLRTRLRLQLDLLNDCDIVNRTTEMAKLYGIQFFDVLSRGSQFRVESMLLRMTREAAFAAPSPSPKLRSRMAAPESIALTMEPHSRLYTEPRRRRRLLPPSTPPSSSPTNYCFSTCLGKVSAIAAAAPGDSHFPLGCPATCELEAAEVARLAAADQLHLSPAGVGFREGGSAEEGSCRRCWRSCWPRGSWSRAAMKRYSKPEQLIALFTASWTPASSHSKLIANVTYGYTSANFSGRMPCVEVADSIVHKGRETSRGRRPPSSASNPRLAARPRRLRRHRLALRPSPGPLQGRRLPHRRRHRRPGHRPQPQALSSSSSRRSFLPCILQTQEALRRLLLRELRPADRRPPSTPRASRPSVETASLSVNKVLERSLRLLFDSMGRPGSRPRLPHPHLRASVRTEQHLPHRVRLRQRVPRRRRLQAQRRSCSAQEDRPGAPSRRPALGSADE